MLKTCLYDNGVLNIRDLLRGSFSDNDIQQALLKSLSIRAKDGWIAEQTRSDSNIFHESMAAIGG